MNYAFNEEDARRFYRWLGHKPDEFTELRAIEWNPSKKQEDIAIAQVWVQNEEDFIRFCHEWNGRRHVYVGVNPRKRRGGFAKDVARI